MGVFTENGEGIEDNPKRIIHDKKSKESSLIKVYTTDWGYVCGGGTLAVMESTRYTTMPPKEIREEPTSRYRQPLC
jgi:hypothetical protein